MQSDGPASQLAAVLCLDCASVAKNLGSHCEQHAARGMTGAASPLPLARIQPCAPPFVMLLTQGIAAQLNLTAGHTMALDVKRLQLFCCSCQDYVYDSDFDCAKLVGAPSSH